MSDSTAPAVVEGENAAVEATPLPVKRSRMELGELTPHNVKQLRLINSVVFPVSYNDKFYTDVLNLKEQAKLAYYDDLVVGGVCCRVDTDKATGEQSMYIMTLGCLNPYRRLGLGRLMLNHVLKLAENIKAVTCVKLHVQISNSDALDFYKKFGFNVVDTIENYYKRVEPATAHLLKRTLEKAA